jgi:hypothetical protein
MYQTPLLAHSDKGGRMDLSNETDFGHFVLLCLFIGLAYGGVVFYVLKKKGFNTKSNKTIILVSLSAFPIVFLPFWLKSSLSWQFKVFVPIFSTVIGIIYYFGIVKFRKLIKK